MTDPAKGQTPGTPREHREPAAGTRERILDASLQLFADHGFARTSLRMITAEAGVNLAAVNYHFGSKDALIAEVFSRLVGPVNEERLRRLDAIEARSPAGPLPLEQVVEAFVSPAMEAWSRLGETAVKLMGRTYSESSEHILGMFKAEFGGVVERFTSALQRTLPDLDRGQVIWRLQFAVGALTHTMIAHDRLKTVFAEMQAAPSAGELEPHLVAFICGGMRAPLESPEGVRRGPRP